MVIAAVRINDGIDVFQVRQSHGCGTFRHLPICTDVDHVVVAGKTEVLHQANLLCKLITVGYDRTPLKSVEELGSMEAENLGQSETSNHPTLVRTTEGMGRVKHQGQLVAVCNLRQPISRAGIAPDVHTNNSGGERRNHLFHFFRIQAVRYWVNVTKDRSDLLPLKGVGSSDKRKGRDDDLT